MTFEKSRFDFKYDCRYFLGDRPCKFKAVCGCEHYSPYSTRILIIKLGALGDVVRTACLLPTMKKLYPDSQITWISKPNGVSILKHHPQIDRLVEFNAMSVFELSQEKFDLVISLDKEPEPAGLCNAVQCEDKRGIMLNKWGVAMPATPREEYYFSLGLDDDTKFNKNTKSYQQLVHDALGLEYAGDRYELFCSSEDDKFAEDIFAEINLSPVDVVALNVGASPVFVNKSFTRDKWLEVARRFVDLGKNVVLLGGPREDADKCWIVDQLDGRVHTTPSDLSETQFCALVKKCDVVLTGDTLAMHVAIAMNTAVLAIFGPTCPQEIELYSLGEKIISTHPCVPCYKRSCDISPNCMDVISIDEVIEKTLAILSTRKEHASK